MTSALLDRYDDRIAGVLSCYDRVVITGTLPTVCYAAGMTGFLCAHEIRIFDYPKFAMTLRDQVRERAVSLAAEAGIAIEHIAKSHVRKGSGRRQSAGNARRSSGSCARHLGHGSVRRLSALARQADAQNLCSPGQRQVSSLLFLLYRSRAGPGLPAGADLGAVSPAVLLQWPELAGAAVGGARHRLHRRRQCFRSHRRLGACASARGWLVA